MREAPCGHLSEGQALDQLKEAVLEAWAEYQATGLHLTGEEADAWLARPLLLPSCNSPRPALKESEP